MRPETIDEKLVHEVFDRLDVSGATPPSISWLNRAGRKRRRRRQTLSSIACVILLGGAFLGISNAMSPSTSEVALAGSADSGTPTESAAGAQVSGIAALRTYLDPSESLQEAGAYFYAIEEDGEPIFSGHRTAPFLVFQIRQWLQDDGTRAYEMRISNRTEFLGQCGTSLEGLVSETASGRVSLSVGQYPQIDGLTFGTSDPSDCGAIGPRSLEGLFDEPFRVEVVERDGLVVTDLGGRTARFQKWIEDEPPIVPAIDGIPAPDFAQRLIFDIEKSVARAATLTIVDGATSNFATFERWTGAVWAVESNILGVYADDAVGSGAVVAIGEDPRPSPQEGPITFTIPDEIPPGTYRICTSPERCGKLELR